ncbi:MAG: polysaccharide deacetylase [Rhodoglobus sp.]|nr:polysaccharide deacetylase [Rhodoglobus sp.]
MQTRKEPLSSAFLLGYDVEHQDPAITRAFLSRAVQLHREFDFPATFFVLGETLERNIEQFRQIVGDPLFDVQQHTYTHKPLKTLVQRNSSGVTLIQGGSLERIRDEVTRTSELLASSLGVRCTGLTGPYTYYRGLSDRPDILEILWDCGIRFLRTDGRNHDDWQPVSFDVQPYTYELQGFPQLLEFGIQGWADCLLREEIGWDNHEGYLAELRSNLELVVSRDLDWSYLQHDWSSLRADPELRLTEALLRMTREAGAIPETYAAYYQRVVGNA